MTAMPRELARKRPANVPAQRVDDGRTIGGRWRATRGGMTGVGMCGLVAVLFAAALFAGFVLSLLSQHA